MLASDLRITSGGYEPHIAVRAMLGGTGLHVHLRERKGQQVFADEHGVYMLCAGPDGALSTVTMPHGIARQLGQALAAWEQGVEHDAEEKAEEVERATVIITAIEDTSEGGASHDPARLVVGSDLGIAVMRTGTLVQLWRTSVEVTDALADPEMLAREALEKAGWTVEHVYDEWHATTQPGDGWQLISTEGTVTRPVRAALAERR